MVKYKVRAVDKDGAVYDGEIDAPDRETAAAEIMKQGHTPLQVRENRTLSQILTLELTPSAKKVSAGALGSAMRELAVLVKAGMPLDRSLDMTSALSGPKPLRDLFSQAAKDVKSGQALYRALEKHDTLLSDEVVGQVRAGEESNRLPEALTRLGTYLERVHQMNERIRSALIYPAIVTAIAALSVVFLVTVVVPRFKPLFANAQSAMPMSLEVLSTIGEAGQSYGPVFLAGLFVIYLGTRRLLQSPIYRQNYDSFMIALPTFGTLAVKADAARYARTLSMLVESGKPLPQAMETAADVSKNTVLNSVFHQAAHDITHSGKLSPLLTHPPLPDVLAQMAKVGEETNNLAAMLDKAADVLDSDVQRTTERLLALLPPALTVLLGLLVAGIISTVMNAIFSLNDLAI